MQDFSGFTSHLDPQLHVWGSLFARQCIFFGSLEGESPQGFLRAQKPKLS